MEKDECCGSGCCDDEAIQEKDVMVEGCGCCVNEPEKGKVRAHFCPKCKSFDVKYIFEFKNMLGMIPKQRCGGCGYTDSAFPILETTKEQIENKGKENINKKVKLNINKKKGVKK